MQRLRSICCEETIRAVIKASLKDKNVLY